VPVEGARRGRARYQKLRVASNANRGRLGNAVRVNGEGATRREKCTGEGKDFKLYHRLRKGRWLGPNPRGSGKHNFVRREPGGNPHASDPHILRPFRKFIRRAPVTRKKGRGGGSRLAEKCAGKRAVLYRTQAEEAKKTLGGVTEKKDRCPRAVRARLARNHVIDGGRWDGKPERLKARSGPGGTKMPDRETKREVQQRSGSLRLVTWEPSRQNSFWIACPRNSEKKKKKNSQKTRR